MSQQQPRRPQSEQAGVKYGDVFAVSGQLASTTIAPRDAAMMQSSETQVLGQNQKGGPASVMLSAAEQNEKAGVVDHNQITDLASDLGVAVEQKIDPGRHIVTESVAGQVVGEYPPARGPFTIGDALEATALMVGDKAIDKSDAAAIQAAEMRATGHGVIEPGGVGAAAESAANVNPRLAREEDKTKLSDVLMDASKTLPTNKTATPADAEAVRVAEMRNRPDMKVYSGGVADTMGATARLNEQCRR